MIELTGRQLQIAEFLKEEKSNMYIARELGVSEYTIAASISNMIEKLGVETRLGIVVKLLRLGILKL